MWAAWIPWKNLVRPNFSERRHKRTLRAMLKLGLVAGYEETETFRCFIKIISKTQTELSDLI